MINLEQKKQGYTIIVSLLIIGFLFVLTAGVLGLVLRELKDNRGEANYLKAYAGAEAASELALLKIKEESYAYKDKVDLDINNRSIVLSRNPTDRNNYNSAKDMLISYDFAYTVNNYNGDLPIAGYDIIPLFYLDDSGEHKASNLTLSVVTGDGSQLSWNIIGVNSGISGIGSFQNSDIGKGRFEVSGVFRYGERSIGDFLSNSSSNYLILFNSNPDNHITYNLKTNNSSQYFTKPRTKIISSARIGNYKQNLETLLDNTEFLNILKYSIYSN